MLDKIIGMIVVLGFFVILISAFTKQTPMELLRKMWDMLDNNKED